MIRCTKLHLHAAHQHENESDVALQRATLAMVPNPIYSGNPIYDEIADPKLLMFLNNSNHSGCQSRDESYVEISDNPASMLGAFPPPDMTKMMDDNRKPFVVSC